jgi:class 3 adenylate cyclase
MMRLNRPDTPVSERACDPQGDLPINTKRNPILTPLSGDALGTSAPTVRDGLPTGTVALLFTDIAGSTQRWEQQPRLMERALERHDSILRQAVESYGGQVFKTVGDAFYTVFTTVPAALEAALAAQRAFHAEEWSTTGPLAVRMALHVGAPPPTPHAPRARQL